MKAATDSSVILLVDIDAFFPQVEQILRPELKGRPVIVGGRASDRSVVASASYEARARGVRTAMPIRQAQRLCPDATFLRGDFHTYARFSRAMTDLCRRYTPLVEPAAPGGRPPEAPHPARPSTERHGRRRREPPHRQDGLRLCQAERSGVGPAGIRGAVPRPPALERPAGRRPEDRRAPGPVQPPADRRPRADIRVDARRAVRPVGPGPGRAGARHRPHARRPLARRPEIHQPRDHLRDQPHRPLSHQGHALLPAGASLPRAAPHRPAGPHRHRQGSLRRLPDPRSQPQPADALGPRRRLLAGGGRPVRPNSHAAGGRAARRRKPVAFRPVGAADGPLRRDRLRPPHATRPATPAARGFIAASIASAGASASARSSPAAPSNSWKRTNATPTASASARPACRDSKTA